MEIGTKELYDAIQEMGVKFDKKWDELDSKLSEYMQQIRPDVARLEERVSQLEAARQVDRETQQWSTGMKITLVSLVMGVIGSVAFGVLGLVLK